MVGMGRLQGRGTAAALVSMQVTSLGISLLFLVSCNTRVTGEIYCNLRQERNLLVSMGIEFHVQK